MRKVVFGVLWVFHGSGSKIFTECWVGFGNGSLTRSPLSIKGKKIINCVCMWQRVANFSAEFLMIDNFQKLSVKMLGSA